MKRKFFGLVVAGVLMCAPAIAQTQGTPVTPPAVNVDNQGQLQPFCADAAGSATAAATARSTRRTTVDSPGCGSAGAEEQSADFCVPLTRAGFGASHAGTEGGILPKHLWQFDRRRRERGQPHRRRKFE